MSPSLTLKTKISHVDFQTVMVLTWEVVNKKLQAKPFLIKTLQPGLLLTTAKLLYRSFTKSLMYIHDCIPKYCFAYRGGAKIK